MPRELLPLASGTLTPAHSQHLTGQGQTEQGHTDQAQTALALAALALAVLTLVARALALVSVLNKLT